jgi:hypothetical protein
MKESFRLALLVCAGFVALALAAPALASYKPSLTVEQSSYKPGAPITADFLVLAPRNDDPTAKITIFSPAGYSSNLGAAPGTKIGHLVAVVRARDLGNVPLPLSGDVVVGSPTDPSIVAASTTCTGSGTNQAVWVLKTTLQGQAFSIPAFVNKVGAHTTVQVCFSPPDIPAGTPGRAPFGAQLVLAAFTAKGVFTNASTSNGYEWAGDFTPFNPGVGTQNLAATNEWRTYVGLPQSLTFKRTKSKKGVTFAGAIKITGVNPSGIRLHLYYGKKASPLTDLKAKVLKTKAVKANGKYTITVRPVKVKTYFQMRFESYVTQCQGPSPSGLPIPCQSKVSEDLAPMTTGQIRVLPPKKRHS